MTLTIDPHHPTEWLRETGPEGDVVLSSRTRFARNLSSFPFYDQSSPEMKEALREEIFEALTDLELTESWSKLRLAQADDIEKRLLLERRLCSKELIEEEQSGLCYNDSEDMSIMINEEDHLRFQSIDAGFQLEAAYEKILDLERELDSVFNFAFHDKWGYLTACPTNLGTGFRGSVLLHLPGLVLTQKINKVLKAISNLGLTVRGFHGEGSESRGFYFQLSNQVTLGQSAEDFKNSLQRVTGQIIEQERTARQNLGRSAGTELEDRIGRSYGILKHARKIEISEALQLLSLCRLGVVLEMVPRIKPEKLDGLLQLLQPAHLEFSVGEDLSEDEIEYYRAKKAGTEFTTTRP